MDASDDLMHDSLMHAGAPELSPIERQLVFQQPRVLLSRRGPIYRHSWKREFFSPFWRIYCNDDPGAYVEADGRRRPLRPGWIYLLPAWLRFRTGLECDRVFHHFLHFEWPVPPTNGARHALGAPLEFPDTGPLRTLGDSWRASFTADNAGPTPAHFSWAHALMHAVVALTLESRPLLGLDSSPARATEARALLPALVRIEKDLRDPPSNPELAALCGLSVAHFARRFAAAFGRSPARYGLERRLLAAARALETTECSIEQIAEETGFTDRFYLGRVFARRLGASPADYRRKHRIILDGASGLPTYPSAGASSPA